MNEKLEILEMAAKKVSSDGGFIAFIVMKYLEFEKISQKELVSILGCSEEDYYKLLLCRAPEVNASDFVKRLTNICQYTNASMIELNKIIKRTVSLLNLSESQEYFMAARDKNGKDENSKK